MSEYEDGLNVACWDWRRTWVKIILSFVPLGLLFVCLTDVQPLCVCTERLLRRPSDPPAYWFLPICAACLQPLQMRGLWPGVAAPLLCTQIGRSSIVRGRQRSRASLAPSWAVVTNPGSCGGQGGDLHQAPSCDAVFWHVTTRYRAGSRGNGKEEAAGRKASEPRAVTVRYRRLVTPSLTDGYRDQSCCQGKPRELQYLLLQLPLPLPGTAACCSQFLWLV